LYRDIPAKLRELIEPVVADYGCELVDAEVRGGRPGLLRITVDTAEGDGAVAVGELARMSREIETQIDAGDGVSEWLPASYRLEVTSPGLDRVLGREKDLERACGRQVRLRTRRGLDGRRQFTGLLVGFEGGRARLEVDGREVEIDFSDIDRANAIYEFTRDDFKRREAK